MKPPKPLLKHLSFLIAKIFFFCIVLFLPRQVSAQTDRSFWFVAPNVSAGDNNRDFNKPIYLRITTSTAAATVVISIPADPSFTPITRNIGSASTETVDLTPWINQLQNTPANTILNKGLLITSTADITAYYEVVSGVCNCNPEIFSLKGKNALGTEYFISSQNSYDESTAYDATNSFDIVATVNNTHVTITPKQNIIGHNANIPFTVVLNKGQTYSAVAQSSSAGAHLQGSYISSDNPVAITLKDDLVQVSSCADLIGDQAVPTNVLGTEYIVTRGFLDSDDKIYILAVEDNTSIYTDGGTSPVAVLAKGQSTTISLSAPNIYIRSDKKIYVYHLTGNGCEVGSAIIPKLNCTGSKSVSIVRSKNELFAVMITTKNGNQNSFTVNGNTTLVKGSDFTPVPGTGGEYVTSRIDLSNGVPVDIALNFSNSAGNFSLGFINGGKNTGTLYGFFSDFKSSNVQNSSLETCLSTPVQLSAYGGVSYQWTPVAGLSNPNIATPMASPAATTDYTVAITTADGCVDHANVLVKVNSVTPSVTIVASANNICPGTLVKFTATSTNGGITPIYQWKVNGVNAGTNSAIFNSTTIINGDKITCVMTSNANCITTPTATSNSITMNINNGLPASVSVAALQNNVCAGTDVNFTATPVNGGTNPVYQWQINGINAGTNSATFSSNTLANGDKVTCNMTSTNSACSVASTTTSNIITMDVNANLPASVSITPSQNNICEGTAVTFTAVPINSGSTPVYQWQVNGVNAGANSTTFISSTFTNGDKVSCLMRSNATCATPVVSTSNEVTIGVNPYAPPSVTVIASTNNICPGESVTFTATALNGGVTPAYQWQVNGANQGTNGPIFESNTFINGDVVKCIVTSSAACTTSPTATSNHVTVNVNLPVSPSVIIAASANNVCYGSMVTFTATPTNGGNVPVYQWLVNGTPAGTNSNTFISSNFNNNDVVSCQLISNAHCAVPATIASNDITMVVNANLSASVGIAPSQNNVCVGTTVTFTATPVNGGASPIYQWQVNGVNSGNNSATFVSTTFINGDKVTCLMTSNATCATPTVAAGNVVTMVINPYVTPSVSITASTNNICPGELVLFTATPLNGGASPAYQWLVNGIDAGGNGATFSSNTFNNSDIVKCILTSNAVCTTIPTATSNSISMNVSLPVSPTVSITASENNICEGSSITFTAVPINGGSSPAYQWLVNGNQTGTNSNKLISSNLTNNDVVSCRLTSNAHCTIPAMVTSNVIIMIINPRPVVDGGSNKIIEKGNSVQLNATASGNIGDITWSPSAGLSNTKILSPIASPDKTTIYTLTVHSAEGCVSTGTVMVTVQVHITVPNTFTPNSDGINDKWEIENLTDYPNAYVQVFNRWGAEVYRSGSKAGAWDGTRNGKPLPVGTYYYIIKLEKNAIPISGYILLLR